MFNCSSNKASSLKQPLASVSFPELIFSIKNSKLKFDSTEGAFKQIANDDPNYRKSSYDKDNDKLFDEEEALKKEIKMKQDKVKYIKEKISEVEKKQEIMTKILNVDINEREYINELKAKCV